MKTKEMIGYLLRFDPETEVSVMVVNPPGRIKHAVEGVICITDCERPFFGIEVGGGYSIQPGRSEGSRGG